MKQADTVERSGVRSVASQEGLSKQRRGFILGPGQDSSGRESSIRLLTRAILWERFQLDAFGWGFHSDSTTRGEL